MNALDDLSWSETVAYACRCGALVTVVRWRWVDGERRPELLERIRRSGPVEGRCPGCGEQAHAALPWLDVDRLQKQARLVLGRDQRAQVVDVLIAHLEHLRARPELVQPWLLQPHIEFSDRDGGHDVAAGATNGVAQASLTDAGVPQLIGLEPHARELIKPGLLASVLGVLEVDDQGKVWVDVKLDRAAADGWKSAALDARPVHLRMHGYPLVGVRVIGAYLGQIGCIDAVLDIAGSRAMEVFRELSDHFDLELIVRNPSGKEQFRRHVQHPGLERNAALCLESARASLGSGEYPPDAFARARRALAESDVEGRLRPTEPSLAAGAYQHLVGTRETMTALAALDEVSRPERLARVLEVEGLPVGEYDAIRRRVLAASLERGLCAPVRFWRRMVASGLVRDFEDYAISLANNRSVASDDDLSDQERLSAWVHIHELCQRKLLPVPAQVAAALGLVSTVPVRGAQVSGEISVPQREGKRAGGFARLTERLRDPKERLNAATALLAYRLDPKELEVVFEAIKEFDTEELLAILPSLSELGLRAVPGLLSLVASERRQVRQAAVILIGMSAAPDALSALVDQLIREPSTAWVDVARALAVYGVGSLQPLVERLRRPAEGDRRFEVVRRVSRAFAEIVAAPTLGSSGARWSSSRAAIERLIDDSDPQVAAAARQALASIADVREFGAQIRGERPLAEVTEVRGFSRRAYEAILVPELEVAEDAEVEV